MGLVNQEAIKQLQLLMEEGLINQKKKKKTLFFLNFKDLLWSANCLNFISVLFVCLYALSLNFAVDEPLKKTFQVRPSFYFWDLFDLFFVWMLGKRKLEKKKERIFYDSMICNIYGADLVLIA